MSNEPIADRFTDERRYRLRSRFRRRIVKELRRLMKIREAQGLTQQNVADRLSIDKALISKRLSGECNMTLDTLSDMLFALDARLNPQIETAEEISTRVEETKTSFEPTWIGNLTQRYAALKIVLLSGTETQQPFSAQSPEEFNIIGAYHREEKSLQATKHWTNDPYKHSCRPAISVSTH